MVHRRQFLTHAFQGSSLVSLNAMVPQFVARTAHAAAPGKDNILVVLEMTGGNDGLNTVIPYADDLYHKARPTLRQAKNDVIAWTTTSGCTPGCGASDRCGIRGSWRSCRASATRTRSPRTSSPWTSGSRPSSRGDCERLAGPGGGREGRLLGGVPILHIGQSRLPLAVTGAGAAAVTVNSKDSFHFELGGGQAGAAEGATPAAGRVGGTDREGRRKRTGLVRAATAGADADGGRATARVAGGTQCRIAAGQWPRPEASTDRRPGRQGFRHAHLLRRPRRLRYHTPSRASRTTTSWPSWPTPSAAGFRR